jgi:hypothetical protein
MRHRQLASERDALKSGWHCAIIFLLARNLV